MESNIKQKLKEYIHHNDCPALHLFCRIRGVSSNHINQPEFSLLREYCYVKQIEYLESKIAYGSVSFNDQPYDRTPTKVSNSNLVYEAMQNAPQIAHEPRRVITPDGFDQKLFQCYHQPNGTFVACKQSLVRIENYRTQVRKKSRAKYYLLYLGVVIGSILSIIAIRIAILLI